jgi:hypothetical protein
MTYDLGPNVMHLDVKAEINYRVEGQFASGTKPFREILYVDRYVDLTQEPPIVLPKPH